MDDAKELAWRQYLEHCTQGRHHETQRAAVSQFTIAIAAAISGLVSVNEIEFNDAPLAAFIFVLGTFGCVFSAKQYERFRHHMALAAEFRKAIERLEPTLEIRDIRNRAKQKHTEEFPRLERLRLHRFWIALHALVAALGVGLLTLALLQ